MGKGGERRSFARLLVLALFCAPALAQAAPQTPAPDNVLTVQRRSLLDTSPSGVRWGSLIVDPGIEISSALDDNIFRVPNGKTTDLVTDIKPVIAIQSDWDRHGIFFGAEGDSGVFLNNGSQNYLDYGVLLSGQYDLAYETYISASVSRAKRHVALGSVDDPNSGQPATYVFTTEQLGFTRALGLIHLDVQGKNEDVSLSSIGGADALGILGVNNYHDRNDKSILTTLAYAYMPGNDLFVSSTLDRNEYTSFTGVNHSSQGTNTRAGIQATTGRGLAASVYQGFLQRDYENGNATSDPYTGFNVSWDATPLTTFTMTIDETFNQATVTDAAGVIQHRHRIAARHSFTDRVSGDASFGYNNNDYVGGDFDARRETKIYFGGVGGDYRISDEVGVRGAYDYQKRLSTIQTDRYTDNRLTVSLVWVR